MLEKNAHRQHISGQFNAELDAAVSHMLEMGGVVEKQLAAAVAALVELDSGEAQTIIDSDKTTNAMKVITDDECFRIIARRQPAASDLRLVLAISKVIIDLERIGDESSRLARQVIALSEQTDEDPARPWTHNIADTVTDMLHAALDAFARRDAQAALAIARGDMSKAMDLLAKRMREDSGTVSACMTSMWALRALERVGDHARNIAEYVIYMVEGVDVRHANLELVLDWLPGAEKPENR